MNKVLNLINKEESDVDYTIHHFPDGHVHLELKPGFNKYQEIDIKCRIRNGNDLFILNQLKSILYREGIEINILHIYYILAGRMDRRMSLGESCDLEIVIRDIIQLRPKHLITYDIHSDTILREYTIKHTDKKVICDSENWKIEDFQYVQICFPDYGAFNRMSFNERIQSINQEEKAFTQYLSENPPILCKKKRKPTTNELSGFAIVNEEEWKAKYNKATFRNSMPIMVIDDLCDGGGTFLGIAEKLRELNSPKLCLFVTHAIQKEGIEKVSKVYDEVFITNSYKNWEEENLPENVTVINIV